MEARRPFETPLFEQAAKHFTGFIGKNDLQTIRFGIGNHFAAVKHPALKGIFSTALKLGDTLFHPLDFREVVGKAIGRDESHARISFQKRAAFHR